MALKKHPFYEGEILVTTGKNDKFKIQEIDLGDGVTVLNFEITVGPGYHYVSNLCTSLQNSINAEMGIQNTYLVVLDRDTGKTRISVDTGSAAWRIQTADTDTSILTGSDEDSLGGNYAVDQRGIHSLGFHFKSRTFASAPESFVSEEQASACWCPSWPAANDGEDVLTQTVVETVQVNGESYVYSFNDPLWDSTYDRYFGGYFAVRTQVYQLIPKDEMDHWYFHFWPEFGHYGGVIAYFEAWDDPQPRAYKLTGESLRTNALGARPHGIQIFDFTITMRPLARPNAWDELFPVGEEF